MMRGYVLAFRPATGSGTIVAENGDTLRFVRPAGRADLHGGDIVSFRVARPSTCADPHAASDVELVQKWSDHLTPADHALVRELYSATRLEQPGAASLS